MNAHQLSQVTNAARVAPVVSIGSRNGRNSSQKERTFQNFCKHDSLEVDQKEPPNFEPISNVERTKLDSFSIDRDTLTAEFYEKIQQLKAEHQKTLTLLNQFYEQEKDKSNTGTRASMKQRQINHLVPEYLDLTENNTFYYGNTPDRGPDKVPGFPRPVIESNECDEKCDVMKDYSDDVSEELSNPDSIDVINRMWDQFDVDKYSDSGNIRPKQGEVKFKSVTNRQRPQSTPTKKKEWKPVITIPKPFNMTIRDEQKSGKSHTRSSIDVSIRQKLKEEEEERERRKKIRARDPPTHIYLPLFEEMCERSEQRSRFNKETSVAATLAIQKPFSFAERDERTLKLQKVKKHEAEAERLAEVKNQCNFEAQPVPYGILDSSAGDRQVEDALYRKIKAKMRAEDLRHSSAYPPRMQAHEQRAKKKKEVWQKEIESETACSFRPRISKLPDFSLLHRLENRDIANRNSASEVVVQPFTLHTSQRTRSRTSVVEDDEKPALVHEPGRVPSFSDTIPARMTDSSRQRMNKAWKSLEDAELVMKRGVIGNAEQEERKKMLARKIQQKAALNAQTGSAASSDERMRRFRKELQVRQSNYSQFLHDIKTKVDKRPLLIEQHDEKVAKEQAERRYQQILEDSGLGSNAAIKNTRASSSYDERALKDSRDFGLTNGSKEIRTSREINDDKELSRLSQMARSSQTVTDSDAKRDKLWGRALNIDIRPVWIKYWHPHPCPFGDPEFNAKRRFKETGMRRLKERKKLIEQVRLKSITNEPASSAYSAKIENRIYLQEKQLEREDEYREFLNEIKRKADERPLLFELHDEAIAEARARQHFDAVLKECGLTSEINKNKDPGKSPLSLSKLYQTDVTRRKFDEEKTCDELKLYDPAMMKLKFLSAKAVPYEHLPSKIKDKLNKRAFHIKHPDVGFRIKPCWVKVWKQTPQPRQYHYKTLNKKWFNW